MVRACADDAREPTHTVRAARGRNMISTDALVGDTSGQDRSWAAAGTGPSVLPEMPQPRPHRRPRHDPQAVWGCPPQTGATAARQGNSRGAAQTGETASPDWRRAKRSRPF